MGKALAQYPYGLRFSKKSLLARSWVKYYFHLNQNDEKNELLKKLRGVSFEQVVLAIVSGDLIDRIKHPNPDKYPNQKIFIIKIDNYIYSVPYLEDDKKIFLKTILPNSKATKKYLRGNR